MAASGVGTSRERTAIALASCAVLVYEIAITRILSVVLWYHFAFLAVAVAMLGMGIPGVWFSLRTPGRNAAGRWLVVSGVLVPLSILALFPINGSTAAIDAKWTGPASFLQARVLIASVCTVVPLLALGGSVCLLLLRAGERGFGRMYGADLFGAALGAAAVVPLLTVLPTPLAAAGIGLLPLVAALVVDRGVRITALATAVGLCALLAWGEPLRLRFTKAYDETGVLWERWTPTVRIAVFPDPFWTRDADIAFGWGFGRRSPMEPVEQLWTEQDGSAGTPVVRAAADASSLGFLDCDVTSVGFRVRPSGSACIIGAGGGRNFLARTRERFDVIQVALTDTWSATVAGAYSLSENHLYTLEAMREYLDHLSNEGILSITRWRAGPPQMESVRLALTARRAVQDLGVRDPDRHLAIVGGGLVATVLVSKAPFGDDDLRRIDEECDARGFDRLWPLHPGLPRDSLVALVLARGSDDLERAGFVLRPATDDWPFFFQTVHPLRPVEVHAAYRYSANESSVITLRWLCVATVAIAVAGFALPLAIFRGRRRPVRIWRGSPYFAAIGVAFLSVEIAAIQRFVLYLGHPSYATASVLAAVLVGSGLGARASSGADPGRVALWRFALPLSVAAVALAAGPVVASTMTLPLGIRVAAVALFLVPPSFLMGLAFPLGIVRFGASTTAWFWAVNGIAWVAARVSSLLLAMSAGFRAVMLLGAAAYIVAAVLLPAAGRHTPAVTEGQA